MSQPDVLAVRAEISRRLAVLRELPELLSLWRAAELLHVDMADIGAAIRDGDLTVVLVGGRKMVDTRVLFEQMGVDFR